MHLYGHRTWRFWGSPYEESHVDGREERPGQERRGRRQMKKWMAMALITLICAGILGGCGKQEPSAIVYRGGAAAPLTTLTAEAPLDVLDQMLGSARPATEPPFLPANADYEVRIQPKEAEETQRIQIWLQRNRVYLRLGNGELLVSTQVDAPAINNLFESGQANV